MTDPRGDHEHLRLWADTLTKKTEGGVTFWRSTGHPIEYASGIPDGTSHRLTIAASGGTQKYNWRTGAIQHGYCGNPRDLNAFEATVYCRFVTPTKTHESVNWIIRGGWHGPTDPDNASCVGMSLKDPPARNSVFRELTHPNYGYADVRPLFPYMKTDADWLGIKVVSYVHSDTAVRNLMYLDTEPYDAVGGKKNNWRRYLEWFDTQGVAMGDYIQAALWAGWLTTFRVDGWTYLDFSVLSAREIDPRP